jgi:hypothetical protein
MIDRTTSAAMPNERRSASIGFLRLKGKSAAHHELRGKRRHEGFSVLGDAVSFQQRNRGTAASRRQDGVDLRITTNNFRDFIHGYTRP